VVYCPDPNKWIAFESAFCCAVDPADTGNQRRGNQRADAWNGFKPFAQLA
jgi:hypothetical protein